MIPAQKAWATRNGGMKAFTIGELDLLIEALAARAARHESESRFNPRAAKPHDDKAAAMRKLRARLVKERGER
jgi:hypothetical protein